jgi:oxygen-dependent protoporphyrinogen oxidase
MSSIAVLGGGISGLSSAYYLARLAPITTKIVLIEGKDRVGGWIHTHRVAPGEYSRDKLPKLSTDKDSILFEAGPRSLRPEGPNGAILLEMVRIEITSQMYLILMGGFLYIDSRSQFK